MTGLVQCSRMGQLVRISARQCRDLFREAEERLERGLPLFMWSYCLECRTGKENHATPTPTLPPPGGGGSICCAPEASAELQKLPDIGGDAGGLDLGGGVVVFACTRGQVPKRVEKYARNYAKPPQTCQISQVEKGGCVKSTIVKERCVKSQAIKEPQTVCRVGDCPETAYGKSDLCFEHLLAQTRINADKKRDYQRVHAAKKRGGGGRCQPT
jgi:hypothetical protein